MIFSTFRLCCPPGVGSIQCWMTLTWWSAATCPVWPRERRRVTSSARYNIQGRKHAHCTDAHRVQNHHSCHFHVKQLNCFIVSSLQLLDMLKFYTGFEINDQTGNALTQKEMTTLHYDRITSLQVNP